MFRGHNVGTFLWPRASRPRGVKSRCMALALPADYLTARENLYGHPLVLDDGTVIDRSKPGPFADTSAAA